ncbi:MAG: histidine kinase dimerization/phospho-acceptor domain-containing protein [Oscillospiraceae bacterium]
MATNLKKIIENVSRSKFRCVLCILTAVLLTDVFVISPFLSNARYYYKDVSDIFHGESKFSDDPQYRSNRCRNAVYSDLCTLGAIYLSQCENNVYKGSAALYENMYQNLSDFGLDENVNIFGLENSSARGVDINQSHYEITDIDSDYYYFYVEYNGSFLTNIKDIEEAEGETTVERLTEKYGDYFYLRHNNMITINTPHDEKGLGKTEVYYTIGTLGKTKLTSEFIDSDQLLFGAAGYDNFGRYIYCFNSSGDYTANTFFDDDLIYSDYGIRIDSDYNLVTTNGYYEEDGEYYEVVKEIPPESDEYILYANSTPCIFSEDGSELSIEELPNYVFTPIDTSNLTVFMSPKKDIVETSAQFIEGYKNRYYVLRIIDIACTAVCAVCFAAFIIASLVRKKEAYREDNQTVLDGLFKPDFALIMLIASAAVLYYFMSQVGYYGFLIEHNTLGLVLSALTVALSSVIFLFCAERLIRYIKINGKAKPKLLIFDIIRSFKKCKVKIDEKTDRIGFISRFKKAVKKNKQRIAFWVYLLSELLVIIILLYFVAYYDTRMVALMLIIAAAINILYIRRFSRITKDIPKLEKQIDEMFEDGELKKSSTVLKQGSPLYELSEKLAEISVKADEAVEKQIKSEKMKIELVTNVSHDLKTPLTSIISYIDLLDKTELSDEARDYVKILSKKSDKLRDIVSDVFTLAKATSGVEIEMQEIDYAILLRQVLADNNDKIEESGRIIRTDMQIENAPINADGGKLYRVIQNLLVNALKYSMPNTRIYITLRENSEHYELIIKNISEQEMTFTADEITERFKRGDESRTDGGSGLGLAIAKSFTEACGGIFRIEIDGDVFIASTAFLKIISPQTEKDK